MSNLDRALRSFLIAPAAVAVAVAVGGGSIAGIVLLVLAAIMLATSAVRRWPSVTVICSVIAIFPRRG